MSPGPNGLELTFIAGATAGSPLVISSRGQMTGEISAHPGS
jgi:hypothetical protein